jgi:hypothetical protein
MPAGNRVVDFHAQELELEQYQQILGLTFETALTVHLRTMCFPAQEGGLSEDDYLHLIKLWLLVRFDVSPS